LYRVSTCRPPSAPLSPYTTLFRSLEPPGYRGRVHPERVQERDGDSVLLRQQGREDVRGLELGMAGRGRVLHRSAERLLGLGGQVDRKSTRLNSSHVSISYAVFCLK